MFYFPFILFSFEPKRQLYRVLKFNFKLIVSEFSLASTWFAMTEFPFILYLWIWSKYFSIIIFIFEIKRGKSTERLTFSHLYSLGLRIYFNYDYLINVLLTTMRFIQFHMRRLSMAWKSYFRSIIWMQQRSTLRSPVSTFYWFADKVQRLYFENWRAGWSKLSLWRMD